MHRFWKNFVGLAALAVLVAPVRPAQTKDTQRQVQQPVREAITIQQATQKAEEKWREERQGMVAAYEALQAKRQGLETQRQALEERVAQKQAQLEAIAQIADQVVPFLQELRQSLARRIDEDLPFLLGERRVRMENLTKLLDDPGVALSDKFRKVFEALMVEAEYGNTIEVYQETITPQGRSMLANIFRLGRIGLYYQSIDRQDSGFFNVAEGAWRSLGRDADRTLQTAIDIAARRQPAQILNIPIGRIATQ